MESAPPNPPTTGPDQFNNQPNFDRFIGIFALSLAVLLFLLQENGVEMNWKWSLFWYFLIAAACTWSCLRHAIPHLGRIGRYSIATAAFLIIASAGAWGTIKQYQREHVTPAQQQSSTQEKFPHLIFSDSPVFTAQRKQHIEEVINAFRGYLKGLGFDVSQQVPPIQTRPGKGLGTAFNSPGSAYDAQIIIGEQWIDTPSVLDRAYALYYFHTTIGDIETTDGLSGQLEATYEAYFLDSYSGKRLSPSGSKWPDALWEIRKQFGASTTDKALFIGLQRRNEIVKIGSANSYTKAVIKLGFRPVLNDPREIDKIDGILATYDL